MRRVGSSFRRPAKTLSELDTLEPCLATIVTAMFGQRPIVFLVEESKALFISRHLCDSELEAWSDTWNDLRRSPGSWVGFANDNLVFSVTPVYIKLRMASDGANGGSSRHPISEDMAFKNLFL